MTAGDDADRAILVAFGANLPSAAGPPVATLTAVIAGLARAAVTVRLASRPHRSRAWPPSDQPDFVNAVLRVDAARDPAALLDVLLAIERELGRVRAARDAARGCDLDLLAHCRTVCDGPVLTLPHPRMISRRFVLAPLVEILPDWRHPRDGRSAREMLAALGPPTAADDCVPFPP
jgi:2-amino-4-hydroxy-6-hydroxymethyldihydropteridine diphosphokinase